MSTSESTTLRVPVALRDEIAQIAEQRGTSMLDVVTDAIRRLSRDEWWSQVHKSLESLDPSEIDQYETESDALQGSSVDGLGA